MCRRRVHSQGIVPTVVRPGAKRVPVGYLALDRVDVLIAAVFLSTLVSRGGLQGI